MANVTHPSATTSSSSSIWGDLIRKLPFAEHIDKLPAPVRDFVARRPGAAIGIAALAALSLMVVKRR